MKQRLKVTLLFVVLILFIVVSAREWINSQEQKDALDATGEIISQLQLINQQQDIMMLRSSSQINNDAISALSREFNRIAEPLLERIDTEHPDTPGVETSYLRNVIKKHDELVEDFKSYHAVIKNSIIRIDETIDLRLQNRPGTEFIDTTMLQAMQHIIVGYYQNSLNTGAYRFQATPQDSRQKKVLLTHLKTVLLYYDNINDVNKNLQKIDIVSVLERLKNNFEVQIELEEENIFRLGAIMFVSAILFLIVGIIAYTQEIKSREKSARLSRELELTNLDLQNENRKSRKLAQQFEQFANALDESAIVSKTDPRGIITYVNPKFLEISGYSEAELIGMPHNVIRHPDMPSEIFGELWDTIKEKKVFKATIKNRRKDGSAYYVDSVVIPIVGIDGEITEYLAVRYNVSELVETRDNALAAQRAKDRFLANMSHELRTPLNAISGFVQIMLRKSEDAMMSKYLQMVLESSNKLLHLINDILDLSKIQSGKFSIESAPFTLNDKVETLVEKFMPQAQEKQITLDLKIKSDIKTTLVGDWIRLSQVLSNLISNALKFTPHEGKVCIRVDYRNKELCCSVEDNGIGMSKEVQERIFKPFEQADDSTTREYGGTGLGLSISKELVSMMHGTMVIDSEEGKGSSFSVTIPLPALYQETSEDDTGETGKRPKLHGHILVAEDNPMNQEVIRLILDEAGLTCDLADDGVEAVAMYENTDYDLVLMDQNMPRMNGIEAMQAIRAEHTDVVPVIALTANVMEGDRERFLEAGMDGFIGKPIHFDEIYEILAHHLKT
jgi:PAS domain S-box-containing protein